MSYLITFISLFLICCSYPALGNALTGQTSDFQKGLLLLKEGKPSEAYSLLEAIPENSKSFVPAILEMQKIHYQRQQWDRFFAYANFYRQWLTHRAAGDLTLQSGGYLLENFSARMFALEVMALGKHCLWEAAADVGRVGIETARQLQLPAPPEIEKALLYLTPLKKIKELQKPPQSTSLPSSIHSHTHYWPIHQRTLLSVAHPKFLRFKVESRCSP